MATLTPQGGRRPIGHPKGMMHRKKDGPLLLLVIHLTSIPVELVL
jgi:hypothetical protein